MYRFHPSVKWTKGYPDRRQIVSQITQLWERYGLPAKTKFNTRVTSVSKENNSSSNNGGRWIINHDPSLGRFDGILAAIGTCGDPTIPHIPNQSAYRGQILHSSSLTGIDAAGKRVLVIGGGASAIEALEFAAASHAAHTSILARSEKWIIPRNPVVEAVLSMNVLGRETLFSWIPERLLRRFFYRDLRDLAPPPAAHQGLFTDTPMVNDDVLDLIRERKADWLRGDVLGFAEDGIRFNHRAPGVPKGGPGREVLVPGELCVLATGFARPSLGFLPEQCFEQPYAPPSWYLQVFPPAEVSVCAANCTYVSAIGTVGNYHIGIYTRFLLMALVDPLARPREQGMKWWIDLTRWIKARAPGGAFEFFTYGELLYWFLFVIVVNPFRWKWALFVLFGISTGLPFRVVKEEGKIRDGLGMKQG